MSLTSLIGMSSPGGTLDVDAGATNGGSIYYTPVTTLGQSFMPNMTGQLTNLNITGVDAGPGCIIDFKILNGENSGSVLFSVLNYSLSGTNMLGWGTSGVNLIAGNKYTWQITVKTGSLMIFTAQHPGFSHPNSDPYINGVLQTGFDYGFRTYMNGSYPLSLQDGVCGTTLSSADQTLNWTGVQGATNYRVRVTGVTTPTFSTVNTRNSTNKYVKLTWIPGIKYGQTYNISVAAYVNGVWGSYGQVCQVSTSAASAAPSSSLTLASQVLSTLDQTINFTGVPLATNYRIEISSAAQSFTTVNVRNNTVLNYKMSWISGVQYGRTYNVRVSAMLNGVWQAYGSSATVTTPSTIPATQFSTCGQSVPSLSTTVNFIPVAGASKYRMEITPSVGTPTVHNRPNNLTTWALSFQTGTKCGEPYSIKIAAYVGGVWGPYGQACTLYCMGGLQRTNMFAGENMDELSVNVYPNPNEGMFNVDLEESAKVEILDMLGRVVYSHSYEAGTQNITLSDSEKGIYFVKITTANQEILKKIIVNK
jgi:hypothetical protein